MALEALYRARIIGGFDSFLKLTYGREDFRQAQRQNFVIAISQTSARVKATFLKEGPTARCMWSLFHVSVIP